MRYARLKEVASLPRLVRNLERLTSPVRWSLVVIAAASALAGFIEAAVLVIVAHLASGIALEDAPDSFDFGPFSGLDVGAGPLLMTGFALVVVMLILQLTSGRMAARVLARKVNEARLGLIGAHANSSWSSKETLGQSALVQLITANASKVGDAIQVSSSLAAAMANFSALLLSAFLIDAIGALAITFGVVVLLCMTLPLIRLSRQMHRRLVTLNRAYARDVHEYAAVGREVQIFGVQRASTETLRESSRKQVEQLQATRTVAVAATAIFRSSALLLILGLLAAVVLTGTDEVGGYAAISLILLRSVSYGQAIQTGLHGLSESAPWVEDLLEKRDQLIEDEVAEPGVPGEVEAPTLLAGRTAKLDLVDLTFSYPTGPVVLDSITLHIPAGQYVGVVGASGAGKSTLIELILGLRRPDTGSIRLDGIDTISSAGSEWRRRIAYVPQEPVLVSGSVRDNVRFYRHWITDEQVEAALRDANVLADVQLLPEGIWTDVGSLGGKLSGGQKQRIAIARSLAGAPSLLVLDEPTSALDAQSEMRIVETLTAIKGRATIIVVTHRWSTLRACDRVIMLDRGTVSADGDPSVVSELGPHTKGTGWTSGATSSAHGR